MIRKQALDRRNWLKTAFVTGVTGQDGSYLVEFLLAKGYRVHGLVRPRDPEQRKEQTRAEAALQAAVATDTRLTLHEGDLLDAELMGRLIAELSPDEVYNLAAQSDVRFSFEAPVYTVETIVCGTLHLLEAIRKHAAHPIRFFQAASSEMYGRSQEVPQSERTPMCPLNPYGCAKVCSYYLVENYRRTYQLFACNGIMYNHESPRRGVNYVTRKIVRGVARIAAGLEDTIALGNIESKRDWGFAQDYVEAMWAMLQIDTPGDYVLATGKAHSVQEFLECAFTAVDLDWRKHVTQDPRYIRPVEPLSLIGNAGKALRDFGWMPKVDFRELVRLMLAVEFEELGIREKYDFLAD